MLYSAAIIRKTYEEEYDTEKECKEKDIRIPDLHLLEMRVTVTEYEHIDNDKFFMNSRVFLSDYDLKNGTINQLSLKQVCNQIIHSYVWSVVHLEKGKIYGVLFASDMYKEKAVYLIEIKEWINIIQEVIEKSVL